MAIVLIGGGARSGKSRYALDRARQEGANLLFIATALPEDQEMRARIARHRSDRGDAFTTIEAPRDLAPVIRAADHPAIVVDCLTLWLSNVLFDPGRVVEEEIAALEAAASASPACVIFVTNEVGCGIVPDHAVAREFRDRAGLLNQAIAQAAAEVYWMVFGQPLRIK